MKRIAAAIILLTASLVYGQQPVNNAQVGGAATATAASGVQKVGIVGAAGTTLDGTTAGVLDINNKNVNGVAILTGNGVSGTGTQRVNIASDNTAFQVKVIGSAGGAFDTAGQNAASPANELLVGAQFNTSPTTVTSGNTSPLQMDATGHLLVNCTGCNAGSTVSLIPATSGGLTLSHLIAAATTNATSLKASAGQLYGAAIYNNASYPVYLKFYNKASAPTVGTDTIVWEVPVQAGTQREVHTEEGLAFATGIAYALTKGITDADTTAVALSDASVDLIYK